MGGGGGHCLFEGRSPLLSCFSGLTAPGCEITGFFITGPWTSTSLKCTGPTLLLLTLKLTDPLFRPKRSLPPLNAGIYHYRSTPLAVGIHLVPECPPRRRRGEVTLVPGGSSQNSLLLELSGWGLSSLRGRYIGAGGGGYWG